MNLLGIFKKYCEKLPIRWYMAFLKIYDWRNSFGAWTNTIFGHIFWKFVLKFVQIFEIGLANILKFTFYGRFSNYKG